MARQPVRQYKKLIGLEDERRLEEREAIIKLDSKAFFDITFDVPGTIPEKIVYDHLIMLRIAFEFQYHYPENWDTNNQESLWIPDFMLPDYNRTLIEVYGTYWHTMSRDSDQLKKVYWLNDGYTVIERGLPLSPSNKSNGGKVVIWWEDEIYSGIADLFARDLPEIFTSYRPGVPAPEIRDAEKEWLKLLGTRARLSANKRLPKYKPINPKIDKLRSRIYESPATKTKSKSLPKVVRFE